MRTKSQIVTDKDKVSQSLICSKSLKLKITRYIKPKKSREDRAPRLDESELKGDIHEVTIVMDELLINGYSFTFTFNNFSWKTVVTMSEV